MPVLCLNGSAYTTSEPSDIMSTEGNSSVYETTSSTPGQSDPGDPLVYILAVLSFYVLTITLLMVKSIHGDREEKNYEYYYQNFIKRDRVGDGHGYAPSAIKSVQPKSLPSKTSTLKPATSNPKRTALKQPQSGTRIKEAVRLVEPGAPGNIKKGRKLPHKKMEPVLVTSV